jgi:hypothetical protein
MRTHRGSVRHILQSVAQFYFPQELRPFSKNWKFRRSQHEQTTRRLSARLRVLADELDHWLDGEPTEAFLTITVDDELNVLFHNDFDADWEKQEAAMRAVYDRMSQQFRDRGKCPFAPISVPGSPDVLSSELNKDRNAREDEYDG